MSENKTKKVGFVIYGDVHVAGAMFDIHDNGNVYIDGVLQRRQEEQTPEDDEAWEAVELRFFNMRKYGSDEKQRQLREVLRYASTKIDTNNGRDWFCVYAADRYAEGCTGCRLGYVEFFADIETLMPGVLRRINGQEQGYKRYKGYSELLRREADNWFVFNGSLPPINEMVYQPAFGCSKEQFKRYGRIIKELYKMMKEIAPA